MFAHGHINGYAVTGTDYPPGALLTLWVTALIANATGADMRLAIKALVCLFLTANTIVVLIGSRRPLLAAFAHLALATNAVGLMYLDVLFAPFVMGAVWAAGAGRLVLTCCLFAIACLMKWQPIVIL